MIEVKFNEPFEVRVQGGFECNFITIPAPSSKLRKSIAVLESEIGASQLKLMSVVKDLDMADVGTPQKEVEESDEKRASDTLQQLAMGGANLSKCYDAISECLVFGGAKFNDEEKIGKITADDIPMKALKKILGLYIINFIDTSI